MVDGVRTTTQVDQRRQDRDREILIGVQGPDGRLRQQPLSPGQPLTINGVNISLDDQGKVTVRGTDKDEKYQILDGRDLGVPGNTVVGIEGNGDPLYLAIPQNQATGLDVQGAGGKDDYSSEPFATDQFSLSINDTQGSNWVTNIGNSTRGRVSVADNQVGNFDKDKGGLELVGSGESGGSAAGNSIVGYLQSAWSWLTERLR